MGILRAPIAVMGLVVFGTAVMLSGPPVSQATEPAVAAIDPEVLQLREKAWRAYFAGDEATLGAMLPPDFIGINMFDGPFVTRDKALEQARSLRASGGRLVSLEFPETRAQRYGDVMIFYGRYAVVVESAVPEPKTRTLKGRLTELFQRRDGRWLHTGWHLDTASTP